MPSQDANDNNDYCRLTTDYFHLITLSALASTFGGMVRPICFAVFKWQAWNRELKKDQH